MRSAIAGFTNLGRSQKSIIECSLSICGMRMMGSMMKSRIWPRTKSPANMLSSVILQRYSRAGCETECHPIEYHLPVQNAMFAWSVLNSLVKAKAMMSFSTTRWMAAAAIIPSRVLVKPNPSRRNMTSKKARSITTAMPWATAARTLPNFLQHMLRIGPMKQAMVNMTASVPALMAMGAKATTPIRSNDDVAFAFLSLAMTPVWALMERYGMSVTATRSSGAMISPKNRFVMAARGTSAESLPEGSPTAFRLYPVIRVLESLLNAIHEEACARELPRDSQRRKSR